MPSEESMPLKISPATLADLYEQLGSCVNGLRNACDRLDEVSTRMIQMGERLAKVETRLNGHNAPAVDTSRSPSNLYESVGKRIEQRGEEVTERIKLEAIVAAQKAVAEEIAEHGRLEAAHLRQEAETAAAQLKLAHDASIAAIELKHKRSMSRIAIVGAVITTLLASGVFAAVKTLFSTEAAQAETQKVLKRIEAKQAKSTRPDAAMEP
jgi:hypothetical protein